MLLPERRRTSARQLCPKAGKLVAVPLCFAPASPGLYQASKSAADGLSSAQLGEAPQQPSALAVVRAVGLRGFVEEAKRAAPQFFGRAKLLAARSWTWLVAKRAVLICCRGASEAVPVRRRVASPKKKGAKRRGCLRGRDRRRAGFGAARVWVERSAVAGLSGARGPRLALKPAWPLLSPAVLLRPPRLSPSAAHSWRRQRRDVCALAARSSHSCRFRAAGCRKAAERPRASELARVPRNALSSAFGGQARSTASRARSSSRKRFPLTDRLNAEGPDLLRAGCGVRVAVGELLGQPAVGEEDGERDGRKEREGCAQLAGRTRLALRLLNELINFKFKRTLINC